MNHYQAQFIFEIETPRNQRLKPSFELRKPDVLASLTERTLGRRLAVRGVIQSVWSLQPGQTVLKHVSRIEIIKLKGAVSLLAVTISLEPGQIGAASSFNSYSSSAMKKLASDLDIKFDTRTSIKPTVVSVSTSEFPLPKQVVDSWLHVTLNNADDMPSVAVWFEILKRVAVERALLARVLMLDANIFVRIFRIPAASRVLRRWKVQLIVDKSEYNASYQAFRDSLNLSAARHELLDDGRSWWAVASIATSLLALGLSIVASFWK